ncbi:hypothetical protein VNN41_06835 [Lactococcus garvieae]|uniref:hypothetical protein n=1 Tax=Lactococcus garvieae TaxID=1363 RepID=UPI003252DF0E
MSRRLTLEQKAEKKFPIHRDDSSAKISSIENLRKSWIKVQQVDLKNAEKEKIEFEKRAIQIGKSILREYPEFTFDDFQKKISEQSAELKATMIEIANRMYQGENGLKFLSGDVAILMSELEKLRDNT